MLSSVHIRNFRGIASLALRFDGLTLLLGENGCGKSSVLSVLSRCLGTGVKGTSFAIEARDFTALASPPPPISIDFLWQEGHGRAWPASWRKLLRGAVDRQGRIHLHVSAALDPRTREVRTDWHFADERANPLPGGHRPELLTAIRQLSPVLSVGRDQQRLVPSFKDLLPNRGAELEPGSPTRLMAMALDVAGRWAQEWDSVTDEQMAAGATAAQMLWQRALEVFRARGGPDSRHELPGTGVQRLVPLLLLRGILEAKGPDALHPDCRPVLLLDHIEAGLHPNVLRAMWHALQVMPAQKIFTTYSADLLAEAPLGSLRRLIRRDSVDVYQLRGGVLSPDELRKVGYHVRARRGGLFFSRCWLLVEGETEFWLLPELARVCGYDLNAEGVNCVEFAQCGVAPLVKLAIALGVEWHLIADGDRAGRTYADVAGLLGRSAQADRVTRLSQQDVEHLLWHGGYSHVYREAASSSHGSVTATIRSAIERTSKPAMALAVAAAAAQPASPGVPQALKRAIGIAVKLARSNLARPNQERKLRS